MIFETSIMPFDPYVVISSRLEVFKNLVIVEALLNLMIVHPKQGEYFVPHYCQFSVRDNNSLGTFDVSPEILE